MDILTLAMAKAYTDSKGAKEFNLADYGIDLMAIAMSGQQYSVEIPNLREKIGDSLDVIFVANVEGKVLKTHPSFVAYLPDVNGVLFQLNLDYVNTYTKNVTQFVFQLFYGDVFGDSLTVDCYAV